MVVLVFMWEHAVVMCVYLRTVWTMGPFEAWGARLMTCIWAAARLAASGSAEIYFIMTKFFGCRKRAKERGACTADNGY